MGRKEITRIEIQRMPLADEGYYWQLIAHDGETPDLHTFTSFDEALKYVEENFVGKQD